MGRVSSQEYPDYPFDNGAVNLVLDNEVSVVGEKKKASRSTHRKTC